MKPLTLTCLLSILFLQVLKSQDTLEKPRYYNTAISQLNTKAQKGYLAAIQDSSLYLTLIRMPLRFSQVNVTDFYKIDYKSLLIVRLSNSRQIRTSFLVSIALGIAAGAIIGYSQGSDKGLFALDAGGKAVVGGIIGGGVGAAIGSIIAQSSKKKFLINGEWKNLEEMKESLQKNQ
jgi:hypothetical protein